MKDDILREARALFPRGKGGVRISADKTAVHVSNASSASSEAEYALSLLKSGDHGGAKRAYAALSESLRVMSLVCALLESGEAERP